MISTPENPGNSLLMRWIRDHLDYPHEDYCLLWPFARHTNGYAPIGRNGTNTYVHRYICQHIHGDPPTPKHHAAHSCGRGAEGCVNPRHLSWKTNSENQLERKPSAKRRKLTPEQVVEIRSLKDLERVADTAARFQVTEVNIRQIQSGKIWRQDKQQRIFTDQEVREIRALDGSLTSRKVAAMYGAGHAAIRHIQKRRSYRHVPETASICD
jgi:hypothetical protein